MQIVTHYDVQVSEITINVTKWCFYVNFSGILLQSLPLTLSQYQYYVNETLTIENGTMTTLVCGLTSDTKILEYPEWRGPSKEQGNNTLFSYQGNPKFKGKLSDSFTNYNYVGNTKVSVSIKKNLGQQMHIKRDISN